MGIKNTNKNKNFVFVTRVTGVTGNWCETSAILKSLCLPIDSVSLVWLNLVSRWCSQILEMIGTLKLYFSIHKKPLSFSVFLFMKENSCYIKSDNIDADLLNKTYPTLTRSLLLGDRNCSLTINPFRSNAIRAHIFDTNRLRGPCSSKLFCTQIAVCDLITSFLSWRCACFPSFINYK